MYGSMIELIEVTDDTESFVFKINEDGFITYEVYQKNIADVIDYEGTAVLGVWRTMHHPNRCPQCRQSTIPTAIMKNYNKYITLSQGLLSYCPHCKWIQRLEHMSKIATFIE
jgi:hypothetical protein